MRKAPLCSPLRFSHGSFSQCPPENGTPPVAGLRLTA